MVYWAGAAVITPGRHFSPSTTAPARTGGDRGLGLRGGRVQEAELLLSPAPPATLGRRFLQLCQASKLSSPPPRRHARLGAQDNTPHL